MLQTIGLIFAVFLTILGTRSFIINAIDYVLDKHKPETLMFLLPSIICSTIGLTYIILYYN